MGFFNGPHPPDGRLLQQEDHRPALQRHAARIRRVTLGPAEPSVRYASTAPSWNLDGEHPEQELHLDDRLHLLVQHEQGVVAPDEYRYKGRRRQGCMAYRRVHDVGDGIPFRRHGRRRTHGAHLRLQDRLHHRNRGAGRRGAVPTSIRTASAVRTAVRSPARKRHRRLRMAQPRRVGAYGGRQRADQRRGHVPAEGT